MKVTPYNFQKPIRLGGALEQELQGWLQTGCALATRRLQKDLPVPVQLALGHPEDLLARSAQLAFSDDSIAYRIMLKDQATTLLALPRPLVLGIINVLMGDGSEGPPERDLTAVDDSLFEFFLRDLLLPPFVDSWDGPTPLRPEIAEKLTDPRFAKVFKASDAVLATPVRVLGPFGELEFRWLIPKTGLGLGGAKLESRIQPVSQEKIEEQVRELPVEMVVRLGSVELPLAELAKLRVGDILMLDQPVNQPLDATVAGSEKLRGWPGRSGGRQAFRVESWR